MTEHNDAVARERQLRGRVKQVQLLGEVALSRDELEACIAGVKAVRRKRLGADFCPTLLALAITYIAALESNGANIWPPVLGRLGMDESETQFLRDFYLRYLRREGLPDFEHLVRTEQAMRFRARILAHAMVPAGLVPEFMEHVVWPAVTRPDVAGATGEEVQQRLARTPPPQLPRAVQRFVTYGGSTARDVIDRAIVFTRARVEKRPDSGYALPPWIREGMDAWLAARPGIHSAAVTGGGNARLRAPVLAFDAALRRVLLRLPYQEASAGDLEWAISGPGFQPVAPYLATLALWARTGPWEEHAIDARFASLQVALQTKDGRARRAWSFPGLTADRPVLFFSARDGRLLGRGDFLEGDTWYVIHEDAAALASDGEVRGIERCGQPLGAWTGYVAECVEVTGGAFLRVGEAEYSLVAEPETARLVSTAPMPAYLAPLEEAVLAFESALPRVFIPARSGQADDSALRVWQLCVEGSGAMRAAASPQELGAVFKEQLGGWLVPLQELIPGEDVGTWDLTVAGPLGQGLAVRLNLLPDLDFHVPTAIAIAGRGAPVRTVDVATPAHIEVLEQGDRAQQTADGRWLLDDARPNGRVPFTVRDPQSGRETSAVILLPTVNWRWTLGGRNLRRTASITASVQELRDDNPVLVVDAPRHARLTLALVAPGNGQPRQSVEVAGPFPAMVRARQFVDTAAAGSSMYHRLELSVEGAAAGSAPVAVGAIYDPPKVSELAAALDGDGVVMRWRQQHADSGLVATMRSEWRPWDPPVHADACTDGQGAWQALFPRLACQPGRYSFEVSSEHGWVGRARLYRRGLTLPDESGTYLQSLPLDIQGLVERAMADAQHGGRVHLRSLAELVKDGSGAAHLLQLFTDVLAQPLSDGWGTRAWEELEKSLSGTAADTAPFFTALSAATRSEPAVRFVRQLGTAQWRSLERARTRSWVSPCGVASGPSGRRWAPCSTWLATSRGQPVVARTTSAPSPGRGMRRGRPWAC